MHTYFALFRGINVGGHNIVPMKELVLLLEGEGYHNVRYYIQSGNVVFQHQEKEREKIADHLRAAIVQRFGFKPTVLLLDQSDLTAAVNNNPFPTDNGKALHFYFMQNAPPDPDVQKLTSLQAPSEQFKLDKTLFYLYAPDGIGRSKLAAQVEKCLGVPATARNWNTVEKLLGMADSIS